MFQTHNMRLDSTPFAQIKAGEKQIELRLYDKKRQKLARGDHIIFTLAENTDEKVEVVITDLLRYATFAELIDDQPSAFFGLKENEDKQKIKNRIRELYSAELESHYGVLGIRIEIFSV